VALSSSLKRDRDEVGRLESPDSIEASRQEKWLQWEMAFVVFLITAIVLIG